MRKLLGIVAVACAVAAGPARATNGMRMIGFGPVQDSMGGASVAAPLDATILVTNPSGISGLAPRVDLSATIFAPSVKYSATGMASGQTMSSERPNDLIPTLAAVYKVDDRITVGVAALGTAGMGVDYGPDLYGSSTYTSYLNMRLAPAAAYRISDQISVGISANLCYARMKYEAGGMPLHDSAGAYGIGATVGASWKPTPEATVAVAYEAPSRFQDFKWDVPSHQVFDPGSGQMVTVPGGTDELSFDQPDVATIGASYRIVPAFLVAADVGYIRWSTTNGKGKPEFVNADPMHTTGSQPWNLNWSDQLVVKVGAELAATKELKIRAGYNYGRNPVDPNQAFESVAFPAIAQHHVTGGVGYEVGRFGVNAAVVFSPDSTQKESGTASMGIASYETKMSQFAFDLGVAYRF